MLGVCKISWNLTNIENLRTKWLEIMLLWAVFQFICEGAQLLQEKDLSLKLHHAMAWKIELWNKQATKIKKIENFNPTDDKIAMLKNLT